MRVRRESDANIFAFVVVAVKGSSESCFGLLPSSFPLLVLDSADPFRMKGLVHPQSAPTRMREKASIVFTMMRNRSMKTVHLLSSHLSLEERINPGCSLDVPDCS